MRTAWLSERERCSNFTTALFVYKGIRHDAPVAASGGGVAQISSTVRVAGDAVFVATIVNFPAGRSLM